METRDTGHLHALAQLEGVAGHRGSHGHVDQTSCYPVGGQGLLKSQATFLDGLGIHVVGLAAGQVAHRRQSPRGIGDGRTQLDGQLLAALTGLGAGLSLPRFWYSSLRRRIDGSRIGFRVGDRDRGYG